MSELLDHLGYMPRSTGPSRPTPPERARSRWRFRFTGCRTRTGLTLSSGGTRKRSRSERVGRPRRFRPSMRRWTSSPRPRPKLLRARRLLAVAAAARAFPELEPRRLVSAALGPTQVRALMAPDESAERLVGRMRAEPIVPLAPGLDGRAAWFMSLAHEVPDADELGPVPCSGRLVGLRTGSSSAGHDDDHRVRDGDPIRPGQALRHRARDGNAFRAGATWRSSNRTTAGGSTARP